MDSEKYLAAIESLCAADLAGGHDESDAFLSGPGYRVVPLAAAPWADDPGEQEDQVADLHALRDHISQRLNDRWGDQHPLWGMVTLRTRVDRGEEIVDPWAALSVLVDDLLLWQRPGSDRWIALGVADRGESDEARLLATASDIDPV